MCKSAAAAAAFLALPPLGGPAFPPVLPLPDLDVPVVLLEGLGEDVGAVVASHEVEERHVLRVGGGLEAGEPRRADRPGGEAGPTVGVVGGIQPQVLAAEVAAPPAEALEDVDDG